jgi:multidrug efflux pump subunit AcrA (membrane-fusion protein)
MKKLLLPLALSCACALATSALAQDPAPESAAPAAAAPAAATRTYRVRLAPPETRHFERRLAVQGSFEAKNYADVAARTDGVIDAIFVDEGDTVVAGETVLFQIDPLRLQNALAIAEQDLAVARASLAVAEASAEKSAAEAKKAALDADRYRRLHDDGKVTDNEYESRQLAHEQAQAGVKVAAAQAELAARHVDSASAGLAIAQKNLADSKVLAPLSGVVTSRKAEPGELASPGKVILRIEDLTAVEAAAYIPAQYYTAVTPGETTFRLVVDGADAGTFPVTYRAPVIDPTLRTFEIKGLVSSPAAVPGAMADLALVFSTHEAQSVPTSAILHRAGTTCIFLSEDNRARLLPVETGIETDGYTELLTPLPPSSLVVIQGQTLLNDSSPLEPIP